MEFLKLKDISERYMELVNPTSAEKVLKIGRIAGLRPGSRVIDFGCGFGEVLALWAKEFGITGEGIDVRESACERARRKMVERDLNNRITIACADAAGYAFEEHSFDVAACIGATFIWDGFQPTLRAMKRAIRTGGKLIVGEAHWLSSSVPPEYAIAQSDSIHTEYELLTMARAEGLDIEYVVRASRDDWDRYESDNWYGLLRWINEHPDDPTLGEVVAHLHESQDEYFRYAREYFGWALYLLQPIGYKVSPTTDP